MADTVSVDIVLIDQITGPLRAIDRQLMKVADSAAIAGRAFQQTGQAMTQFGTALTVGVTLPVLGLGAASIKAASDAEETQNKFNVVFSDIAEQANSATRSLAQGFGLAQTEAQTLLADTGDLLTGFGFTQKSALDLSNQVQELAVDLASFTNFSGGAKGASEALTKALLGERESIKSLGIAILEEDVKAKVKAIEAAGRFTDETERERKAIATLEIALEQSKNAIGDFERSSTSFANQLRILRARTQDLVESFGRILLPIANKVVGAFIRISNKLNDISPAMRKAILVFAGLAAALGPVLLIVGKLVTTFGFLLSGIAAISAAGGLASIFTAMAAAIAPILPIILAVSAVLAGIFLAVVTNLPAFKELFVRLFERFGQIAIPALQLFKNLWEAIAPIVGIVGKILGFTILVGLQASLTLVSLQLKLWIGIADVILRIGDAIGFNTDGLEAQLDLIREIQQGVSGAAGDVGDVVTNQLFNPTNNVTVDNVIEIQQDETGEFKVAAVSSNAQKSTVRAVNRGSIVPAIV